MLTAASPPDILPAGGLTSAAASLLLAAEGPNELPRSDRRSALRIIGEVLREPMLALLLAGGVAYLLLGDMAEALILLAFATFSIAATVIQETRTEHVLEALRDLSAPRALVIRDGERTRIAGREVVRGDLLILEQGDRIAANAELVTADDFQADESLLTGESLPVRKLAAIGKEMSGERRPGGEVSTIESIESRENHAAIEVEEDLGFTAEFVPGDPTVVRVSKTLHQN